LDGDFGGTWVAVNEYGITLALVNWYGTGQAGRSRGLLVRELAIAASTDELRERIAGTRLADVAGFRLVILRPALPAWLLEWDGSGLTQSEDAEHRMPLTSSSFDAQGAAVHRRFELGLRIRETGGLSAPVLDAFHRSHGYPESKPSAYSTCMHRPDAETVSFARVGVSADDVRFEYTPAAPCCHAPVETVRLERKE
jgi:hypothetical protein